MKATAVARSTAWIFLAILLPLCYLQDLRLRWRTPGAVGGDEPHYLVMAHSLARDFDLRLGNNYDAKNQAGRYFQGVNLDRHSYLYDPASRTTILWTDAYALIPETTPVDYRRLRVVLREDYNGLPPNELIEINLHPPGYAVILAAAVGALLRLAPDFAELSILFVQIALYAFAIARFPLQAMSAPGQRTLLALATVAAYYAASYYGEALAVSLTALAAGAFLRNEGWLLNLCIAGLVLLKEALWPTGLAFAALAGWRMLRDKQNVRITNLVGAGLALLLPAAILAGRSFLLFGEFRTYIPWEWSVDPLGQCVELLIGAERGVFVFSPVIAFALLRLVARRRSAAPGQDDSRWLLLAAGMLFVLQLAIASLNAHGLAGSSFGFRAFIPQGLLLLLAALAAPVEPRAWRLDLMILLLSATLSAANTMDGLVHRFQPPLRPALLARLFLSPGQ